MDEIAHTWLDDMDGRDCSKMSLLIKRITEMFILDMPFM
jgi:hypothetical protein